MPPRIPITDPKRQYTFFKKEIDAAIQEVLDSGRYMLGPNVEALEREVAMYCGVKQAIAVASGTDALHLALRACDIGQGDEVITTPFTFAATVEAITYTGAIPVLVDIDPETFNLDPALAEAAITDRTRAILPVHLYGQAADLAPLVELCATHGLRLIEDCAQSFGADYRSRKTGAYGALGCFSFYPSKNLSAMGDAGMVVTDDPALADAVRVLRQHGSQAPHRHAFIGYNSRLDELQAAVLRVKLRHIEALNERRRERAAIYNQGLRDLATTPREKAERTHVYGLYTIRYPDRDNLARRLARHGVASAVHYRIPLHLQDAFRSRIRGQHFPAAEQAAEEVLSLPMFPELRSDEVTDICEAIARFAEAPESVAGVPGG